MENSASATDTSTIPPVVATTAAEPQQVSEPDVVLSPVENNIQVDASAVSAKKAVWPSPIVEDFNDADWPNLQDSDEHILEWVMKNKRLLVRTVTWNLCAKPPPPKEETKKTLLCKK